MTVATIAVVAVLIGAVLLDATAPRGWPDRWALTATAVLGLVLLLALVGYRSAA